MRSNLYRFEGSDVVYEAVGSMLLPVSDVAFDARGLDRRDVRVVGPDHPVAGLPILAVSPALARAAA